MPNDLTTVVFPDGTQPTFEPQLSNPGRRHSYTTTSSSRHYNIHQHNFQSGPTPTALLTTLSRYLHHRRWVWGVSYPTNKQLPHAAVARILNTITK